MAFTTFKPTDLYSIIYDIANSMPIVIDGGSELFCKRLQTAALVKDYASEVKTSNLGKDARYIGKKIFFSRGWNNAGQIEPVTWNYPALFYGEGAESLTHRNNYDITYSFAVSDRCEQVQTNYCNQGVCESRTYEEVAQDLRRLWQAIYRTLNDYVYAELYLANSLLTEGFYTQAALAQLITDGAIDEYKPSFFLASCLNNLSESRVTWDMHTENAVTYFVNLDITFLDCAPSIAAMPQENIPQAPTYDADAQAFFVAAGITDEAQKEAVNDFVVGAKAASLWAKAAIIAPIVGGSATSHKYNLKNPLDTNAAYRLSFFGGWLHSSTGAKPNGIDAYADTFFTPELDAPADSLSIGYYSGSNLSGAYIEAGCAGNATNTMHGQLYIAPNLSGTNYRACNSIGNNTGLGQTSAGCYSVCRDGIVAVKSYKNGVLYATDSQPNTVSNQSIAVGATNNSGVKAAYSARECRFFWVFNQAISDAEQLTWYNLIQQFQTALGRNI